MEGGRSQHQEDPRRRIILALYIFCIHFTCKLKLFLSQALGSSYIVVGSSQIEMKDYAKYLCVMIDSNLVWKYHTQSICHKMRKEKQLRTTTTTTKTWVLQLSADSTLCPASCFTFSIQVINHLLFNLWNLQLGILCREVSKEDPNSRALSLICYSTSKEHTVPFFVKSNCLPILNLFFFQRFQ